MASVTIRVFELTVSLKYVNLWIIPDSIFVRKTGDEFEDNIITYLGQKCFVKLERLDFRQEWRSKNHNQD